MKCNVILSDERLRFGLTEIAPQLGLELFEDGIPVYAERGEALSAEKVGESIRLTYTRDHEFFRALSMLKRAAAGHSVRQTTPFRTFCYSADMSRNAVLSVDSCKRMIRYLAILGYDSMMLYTEDTYEVPEYPYFGRMRGRYSQAELRELDDYAYAFGIEMIPYVQTLAHLNAIFRWPTLGRLRDIDDILLVDDERTYALIDKMLASLRKCLRHSNLIHLSMDEAAKLGKVGLIRAILYRIVQKGGTDRIGIQLQLCHDGGNGQGV